MMGNINLDKLGTEARNKRTLHLDELTISEFLNIMNEEDHHCAEAVKQELATIQKAIEKATQSLKKGGRIIYIGAGTSGRLGILDAVECVPTFSTSDEVIGIIAGGNQAFVRAVEGAEDSYELAEKDLKEIKLKKEDILIGIAASGRTPYVIGALEYATEIGASTVTVSCNKQAEISQYAQVAIEVDAGPEILTGSTRLKAGTCQKLILNMISTASMVGFGKVYGNLMVDVKATNLKLVERSKNIIMMATDCSYDVAEKAFYESGESSKIAIVMILTNCNKEEAIQQLNLTDGFISKII